MMTELPTAAELFNLAFESYERGDVSEAVACLRNGFFENLYVAPTLLGEDFERQKVWYPSAESEPRAAAEYASRYGARWRENEDALQLLEEVWNDPLVRQELRRYINLSKAILQAENESQQSDYLRERERFLDPRRIRRTQSEILGRLQSREFERPRERPRVALVLMAARDPRATVEFFRRLFGVEPAKTSRVAGGYAEFDLPGVRIGIHGHDQLSEGDAYQLGPPPRSLGWGVIFVIRVSRFEHYWENAVAAGVEIVDSDLATSGRRFFLVRDPSGYLLEVTEEEPEGV